MRVVYKADVYMDMWSYKIDKINNSHPVNVQVAHAEDKIRGRLG